MNFWIKGYAFGAPLICLGPMYYQARRLARHQQASYDEDGGYRVWGAHLGVARKIGATCAIVALLMVNSLLGILGQEVAAPVAPAQSTAPTSTGYALTNPMTGTAVTVPARWEVRSSRDADGYLHYEFIDTVEQLRLLYSSEDVPGVSLTAYAEGFKAANQAIWAFDDSGYMFYTRTGDLGWRGTGRTVDGTLLSVEVIVVQHGTQFWRTVAYNRIDRDFIGAPSSILARVLLGPVRF